MWIPLTISRRPKKVNVTDRSVVRVQYRDFAQEVTLPDPTDVSIGYAYRWTLQMPPEIGARVIVPGGDGRNAEAVIVGFGTEYTGTLNSVRRVASAEEVTVAWDKASEDERVWLDLAARAAGFPASTRRRKVPDGFPSIAPIDGAATAAEADDYGRMWWRAYKRAEEAGRPAEEIKRLSDIAHRWYAVRDNGGNV